MAAASGTSLDAQASLVAFFLEATRGGFAATDELTTTLSAVLPTDRAHTVALLASEGQPAMRTALQALSLGPDELVDVAWQRYVVATAGHEQPRPGGTPMYTVTLTTRAVDGSTKPLQFTASTEELAELVRELKNAMRLIEREIS